MAVKSTLLLKKQGALLTLAISKLRPNVFSHPVWVRFSKKDKIIPPETIQDLFGEAEQLQQGHPGDAFQVLLICAVYQNYSGQRTSALTTIQKALDLAQRNGLTQEVLWAIWGACAICIQQGNYEQADIHFGQLQAVLNEQNEWVLADYIDVVRQFFLAAGVGGTEEYYTLFPENQNFEGLLPLTLDWLHLWGCSADQDLYPSTCGEMSEVPSQGRLAQPLIAERHRQGPWHTLKLFFHSELRLQWERRDIRRSVHPSSFWGSILNPLRRYFTDRKAYDRAMDTGVQTPGLSALQEITYNALPGPLPPAQEPETREKPGHTDPGSGQAASVIPVSVHMLGRFMMSVWNVPLRLPASRSLSLLKYLMLNHKQILPREVLMDVFWPDAEPETARNNLNVAIHAIRRALRDEADLAVILYKDGAYHIAPEMQVWLDVEEFERLASAGRRLESRNQLAAVSDYEAAISLYQGDFLEENPYEGWTVLTRESLRMVYLNTLDSLSRIYFSQERYAACITACQRILDRDRCREDAHCMLMRCYNRQGQDHMALRQYQACVGALRLELEVEPAPETIQLYHRIRRHENV